jgi:2-dehydro-3-deoxyphosphogluconate aldolase/(4S)-4-hydroxy-2-oxoglutarate aldolase
MESNEIYARIGALRVVPVIAIENFEAALPLADALLEGGLPVAEITFRTNAAAAVIERIAKERPDVFIGAGTLLSAENLRRALECGARFGVAPGLNPEIVRAAQKIGLPFSPGIMTPSDIEAALSLGVKVLKFFPAGAAGGVKMLTSIAAPYVHLGVRFVPTGGVSQANMKEYLEQKSVLAVGGTWIATHEDIAGGRWNAIRENCRGAVEVVHQMKVAAVGA